MTEPVAVRIRRLPHGEGLALPAYATHGAAGMDVLAAEDVTLAPGARHRRHDHLRDALSAFDDERLLPEIDQDHFHFAAVIAVDRARSVGHADAVLEREARAWTDLHLITLGNRDREAGRNRVALSWRERDVLGGNDVKPRRMFGRSRGQRKPLAMRQALKLDVDHFDLRPALRPFFAGPLAARSSIRRTASSSVTASGIAPLGNVALVEPSVT